MSGWGCLATKININFFIRNEVLNIFQIRIFSKKTLFSKITAKNNLWGHDYFSGNRMSHDDKNEYNLFHGKWGTQYGFEIFSSKPLYGLNKSQKISFGATFPPISMVLLDHCFQKKIGFTHVYTHTNHVKFMKISLKLRLAS